MMVVVACWACTAAAAWLISDEVEMDFCSITSDMLRFFRMGFFTRNEFDLDKRLTGSEVFWLLCRLEEGWRGPYNQVTSLSFSLAGG